MTDEAHEKVTPISSWVPIPSWMAESQDDPVRYARALFAVLEDALERKPEEVDFVKREGLEAIAQLGRELLTYQMKHGD